MDRGQLNKASAIGITQKGFVKLILWPKQVFRGSENSQFVHLPEVTFEYTTVFYLFS